MKERTKERKISNHGQRKSFVLGCVLKQVNKGLIDIIISVSQTYLL